MSTMNAAKPAPTSSHRPRAEFSAQWLSPATAVISVHGELDASNAADLVECGMRHSRAGAQLVLDLSTVEFFGAGCFACLHTLNVRYAGDDVEWVLIPSRAVSRVLRICDPARALPVSTELPAALSMLHEQPRPLQLVNTEH
ncbi:MULTISPECIES: STAS domain-containing protein [Mycolicibacterium]|uniref:Anti-sigma-factor antagonist n=1 Tax=Mycolicibacterium senegalense TaxID=1796 RepID=A0A378W577_9MYCO|nr:MULTISPECIES: STAS domain-containing protein [Mycolicibacterium]MDR7291643.1 anti-anti-sigma factor [Mycolicibacterium senegalense]CDP84509.1 STAS domain-containing protein [Mycolicibacterium farcinogenes]SUA27250.1 anti-sigma-factor antagonist [Mycolicibacterium senegalense]